MGYWIPGHQIPTWIGQARLRLAAAGWRLSPLQRQDAQAGEGIQALQNFTAETPELQLSMWAFAESAWDPVDRPVASPPAGILVEGRTPAGLPVLSAAAFVTCLLAGWQLTGWVVHRCRRGRRPVLLLVSAVTVVTPAVLLDADVVLFGTLGALMAAVRYQEPLTEVLMEPTLLVGMWIAVAAVALAALVTVVVAAAGPPRRSSPSRGRTGATRG